ncbi:MAG: hypothetical protein GQ569_13420 [Methylococcaceae bacterium]|nr:hypothetical protein [Methylococcaceae bacterium]
MAESTQYAEKLEKTEPESQYHLPEHATVMQLVDALLKAPEALTKQLRASEFKHNIPPFLLIIGICYLIYGIIVGSFSGDIQWVAAPLKMLFGISLSALLCYPSLYIFACLSGATITPQQTAFILSSMLALSAILLIGFAPVAFIFSFSIKSLTFMGALHLAMWAISMNFSLRFIKRILQELGAKEGGLMTVWSVILIITILQMTTILRPILGKSDVPLSTEKLFFIEHWGKTLGRN